MSKKKNVTDAIEHINGKFEDYVKYFEDTIVHDDNIVLKAFPHFETKLYVPGAAEKRIDTKGTIVKVGNNLDKDLLGKTIHWDAGRNPITMLNRIEVKEFEVKDIPVSEVFIVIHKNIFTYIK